MNQQAELGLEDAYGERKPNDYVNEIRTRVAAWRALGEAGLRETVTPVTARLLRHWRDPERTRRLFFCQIEAVETAIWLAEVALRTERDRLQDLKNDANPDLFRIAFKVATGAGKTTIMAMLIAWQTLNARGIARRFTDAFLIVAPGITVRDRLRVLLPVSGQRGRPVLPPVTGATAVRNSARPSGPARISRPAASVIHRLLSGSGAGLSWRWRGAQAVLMATHAQTDHRLHRPPGPLSQSRSRTPRHIRGRPRAADRRLTPRKGNEAMKPLRIALCALAAAGVAGVAGCASAPGAMRASAQANPAAACATQIHSHFPILEGYLDQKLRRHAWFNSSVTGVTLDPSRDFGGDSAVALSFPTCGAILHLADGSEVRGSFEFLYRDDNSLSGITWNTSGAWDKRATRDYWLKKYGEKEFDRRVAAHKVWIACLQAAGRRELYDPRFLPQSGDDASWQMAKNDIDDAKAAGETERCGMDPPGISGGWDGDLP